MTAGSAGAGRPAQDSRRWPTLVGLGAGVQAYWHTVRLPRIVRYGAEHHLIIPGEDPLILAASTDRLLVDWIDFSIELLAGLIALVTGFTLGRDSYAILRPFVNDVYHNDPAFRDHVHRVGERTLIDDPLGVGRAARDLWVYLWRHYRRAFFQAIARVVGRAFRPQALLLVLLRWLARMISAGTVFLVELGMLLIPLGRKLRGEGDSV